MNTKTCLVFLLSSLIITNIASAQGRAPHGLVYETPVAFSPSAFDFFHAQPENPDDTTLDPCAESSSCSPLPVAAKVQGASAKEQQSEIATMSIGSRSGMGAGGAVMIIFGLVFPMLM